MGDDLGKLKIDSVHRKGSTTWIIGFWCKAAWKLEELKLTDK
jgi:hypothetical protein